MEKIYLSKYEKQTLRIVEKQEICPSDFPLHIFASCVDTLERKGLAKGAWQEGHILLAARLTDFGKNYIIQNPNLTNPTDWRFIITTAVAVASALGTITTLLVTCS